MSTLLALLLAPAVGADVPEEAPAADPGLPITIVTTPSRPRGPSLAEQAPSTPVTRTSIDPRIDGVFEPVPWEGAEVAPAPWALRYAAPPDPSWDARVMATPGGLAVALSGLPREAETVLSVDPDGSRLGYAVVDLSGEVAVARRCAARDVDTVMPFPVEWPVYYRPCDPDVPAQAVHGPDGWEVLLPWSLLGPTTDDLQLQWWTRTDAATASFDKGRASRPYAGGARNVEVVGAPERSETIAVRWDRGAGTSTWTLVARGLEGPEPWLWEAHWNGRPLHRGRVVLEPNARGVAVHDVELPLQAFTGTGMRIRQDLDAPLARGAWTMPWALSERATVATPVHRGTLEIRFKHTWRDREVPLAFRTPDGTMLHEQTVVLPSGEGQLFVELPDDWPDHVHVRLDGLFPEPWIPVVRAGATARALGGRR